MGQSGMAISRIVVSDEKPQCLLCQYTHDVSKDDFANSLRAVVGQYGLQNSACHWVLHSNDYRVLQIDRPKVPASEYNAAAQWLIKDMVDFPVESAVLDTFLPASQITNQSDKLYVVVAQRDYLASFKAVLDQANLDVVSITIKEMAMRNVLAWLGDEPIALFQMDEARSLLLIVESGNITMMRTINVGLRQIDEQQVGADRILEEVERSIKYYSQQLRQSAPQKIYLAPLPETYQALCSQLQQSNIQPFDLRKLIDFGPDVDGSAAVKAFNSIGAALTIEKNA